MIKSLFMALRMYSRIPVPEVEWNEENRRYSLCFFPVVGVLAGMLLILWNNVCTFLSTGGLLFGAGAVMLIVLLTGGIHLDGFCDTCDARASWGDRQRRLEILSDPHIGSFAVIKLVAYMILYTALMSMLYDTEVIHATAWGYVLSRSLSGLAAVTFKSAKKEGTLFVFTDTADKKATLFLLSFTASISCFAMIAVCPQAGLAAAAASLLIMAYYRYVAFKEFGGITGDLAGWFLQVCEIAVVAAVVFVYRILEVSE
ncbi:MAG: adenosylcobinamide-GDP ribazoletransferase [Ruminococcus sp.]|nr:adenosylcobinamide-GDP ribazoletransferase [Ruminococcus sp.]